MATKQFPCELEGWNIVLRGNFNPAIFHPSWFQMHGLVSAEEAKSAAVEIVRPELTSLLIGPIRVFVRLDKFQAEVTSAEFSEPVRDFVLGTFNILKETPLTQLGINRHQHFKMPSVAEWHRVGHTLAPKEIWADLLSEPGTRSLVIEGKRNGSEAAYVRVTVQPSAQVAEGVYVGTNEHFAKPMEMPSDWLLDRLRTEWGDAQKYAKYVAEEVISRCLQ